MKEMFTEMKSPPRIEVRDAEQLLRTGLEVTVGPGYEWDENYAGVADWLSDNGSRGLLLAGGNGTGKTLLATRIIPPVIRRFCGVEPCIAYASDLTRLAEDPLDYARMRSSSVIVIDDFGVEGTYNRYGEKRDLFSEFVDLAEREAKLLVLTTNISGGEIQKRYGARTYDRLRCLKSIVFTSKSRRK